MKKKKKFIEIDFIMKVALFLEYYDYNLKYYLSKKNLDNSAKTRIIVENTYCKKFYGMNMKKLLNKIYYNNFL